MTQTPKHKYKLGYNADNLIITNLTQDGEVEIPMQDIFQAISKISWKDSAVEEKITTQFLTQLQPNSSYLLPIYPHSIIDRCDYDDLQYRYDELKSSHDTLSDQIGDEADYLLDGLQKTLTGELTARLLKKAANLFTLEELESKLGIDWLD